MINYFINVNTLSELKKQYHTLALKFHPDCGGSDEKMKELNLAYETRFEQLKKQYNATASEEKQTTEAPEEFVDIINCLLRLNGLEIELCGSWLWIGGNTKEHKEKLKAAGCRWAPKKGLWSWHHEEIVSHKFRGNVSMDDIRNKYGSTVYRSPHPHYLPE